MSSENDTESEYLSTSSDENNQQNENLQLEGNILKNYNIICEIGRGAYSIVWLAFNITNNNFYALKVQDPSEFKAGKQEIEFVEKLPKSPAVFNNIIESFIEIKNSKKYLCSVWELHCSNIDCLLRKGNYTDGFPIDIVKKIMKQLTEAIKILHKKFRVFHGDIKTDNILIKGVNDRDSFLIRRYNEEKFFDKYSQAKKDYCLDKGKKIDKMKSEEKLYIRLAIHKRITEKIMQEYNDSNISKYSINQKYLEEMNISLADFGTHCNEDNYYEEPFGTRYYMAPEIILMGKCSLPVDIWALGCTFYELLTGNILFDPIKDSNHSRDYYHLKLICETSGEFSPSFIKKTKYGSDYFDSKCKLKGYEYPSNLNRLDRKLESIPDEIKSTVRDFFKGMLSIDPSKRWTIDKVNCYPDQ